MWILVYVDWLNTLQDYPLRQESFTLHCQITVYLVDVLGFLETVKSYKKIKKKKGFLNEDSC